VCSPERTPGLLKPAPKGNHTLVELKGPGVFLGAEVLKTCGDTDETTAVLTIDDRIVFTVPFVSAHAIGLTRANNIGVVLLPTPGPSKSLSIGFPTPLRYDRSIVLSVDVQEDNVSQILGNIWHGAAN
jgi:hypothetical protein